MNAEDLELKLSGALDVFADLEHQRWAHWQQYMHSRCAAQSDGSLVVPAALAAQWQTQIETPFESLTEREKESDREQVRKYFPLLMSILSDESEH